MSNEIRLTSTVVAIREQVSADLADEAAILNLKDGVYYGLNPVGASVWKLIQQPKTVREVREAIVAEYEVEAGRCERELFALLDELATRGLIEVRGGQPEKAA